MASDVTRSTHLDAVVEAIRASVFAFETAARVVPGFLARLVLANVVVAIAPAGQVIVVAWLVRSAGGSAANFLAPLLALTVLVGVSQVVSTAVNMTEQRTRIRMTAYYEGQLTRCVAAMSPQRLASVETSSLIQACRSSLFDLGHLLGGAVAVAASFVTAVSLCVTVWTMSPLAGVLVLAALVPIVLVQAWSARMQDRQFVPYGEAERRAQYGVEQLVSQRSATELITLGSSGVVAQLASRHRAHAVAIMDRILVLLTRANTAGGGATAVLLGATLTAILIDGAGGAGIAAGIVGVLAAMQATRSAGFSYGSVMSTAPKARAFRRLMSSVEPSVSAERQDPIETLDVEGLSITYPGAVRPAVQDLTFSMKRGEVVAFVGINGAGKTTAVNGILGVVSCDSGRVRADDRDLASLRLNERLSRFGLLIQEFGRYEFTVRDSVRIGRPDGEASDSEIWAALDSARAGDFVRGLPLGLDTQLGSQFGGIGLSGGQWQRLALARIYLRNAPIWILDEPTSAIDAEAEQQIFTELQRTKAARLTIVVSHRAWTLKGMDRIYVFDEGRVVQQGTYEALLSDPLGRFAQIFAEQTA